MKTRLWIAALAVFVAPLPLLAEDATWNGVSGNWSDDTHWSSTAYPDNDDPTFFDVFISSSTVTQDVVTGLSGDGVTIDSLTWTGGIIAGANPITVLNSISWSNSSSQLSNTGGLNVGPLATLTFAAGSNTLRKLNDNAVLNVDGTVEILGAQFNTGASAGNAATINISSTGVFDLQGDAALTDTFFDNTGQDLSGVVQNSGTFKKSSGTNANIRNVTDDWTFNNAVDGTVAVEDGTLIFSGSGNGFNNAGLADVQAGMLQIGGGTSTGTFDVASGATLRVFTSGSSVQILDGATINNAGTLELNGHVQFTNSSTITGTLAASIGNANSNLAGTDALAFDALTWSAGRISNTAGVTVNDGGTLTISGSTAKQLGNNAQLTIAGTATVTGTQGIQNVATVGNGSTVHIAGTGLFDLQSDAGFSESPASQGSNAGTLQIDGTLRKSAGTGISDISGDWTVINDGLVEVQTGTLRLFPAFTNNSTVFLMGDEVDGGNIEFLADVSGAGNFTGAGLATFQQDYHPGASTAEVTFGGDVEFGSSSDLFMEIDGTILGDEYDSLTITGTAALNNSDIFVDFIEAPEETLEPMAGQMFTLLSAAGGVSGNVEIFLPDLTGTGLIWEDISDANTIALQISEEFMGGGGGGGDYDGNGSVGIEDYVVFRDLLGETGPDLAADGTGDDLLGMPDGDVDQFDYEFMVANYGQVIMMGAGAGDASGLGANVSLITLPRGGLSAGGAVPEPGTLALLLSALAILGAAGRRHRA